MSGHRGDWEDLGQHPRNDDSLEQRYRCKRCGIYRVWREWTARDLTDSVAREMSTKYGPRCKCWVLFRDSRDFEVGVCVKRRGDNRAVGPRFARVREVDRVRHMLRLWTARGDVGEFRCFDYEPDWENVAAFLDAADSSVVR